ncbi:MAG: protein kinase [Kiritimatiellae bacterium]|nr:protein kinase [Kiritimatiellia bacterium]
MPETPNSEIEGFLRAHGPFEKPPILSCGERVGDWTVRAFLGRGGSAEVFRAENVVTGIVGALKVLYRTDDRSRERFRREARIIAETRNAAFPLFYGAGDCDGRFYIAEELLEPITLPSDDTAVARYILGVAAGIEVLHRRGFVHRDLKPGNVLMRPATGESVLIDMGLAKGGEDAPQMHGEPLSVVDGHAVGVGTPGFSAPEQFTGGKVSAATDIHALGVLVDACFKGKPPKAWADIIRRSTSSIPGQRYASVTEFVRAVRRRHATRHLIAAIAVVLFIAGTFVVLYSHLDKKQEHPKTLPVEVAVSDSTESSSTNSVLSDNTVVSPTNSVLSDSTMTSPTNTVASDSHVDNTTNSVVPEIHVVSPAIPTNAVIPETPVSRSAEEKADAILETIYDKYYGGREKIQLGSVTNVKVRANDLLSLGKTTYERGLFVTRIALKGKDISLPGEIKLTGKRRIEISGYGRLTASISGSREVRLELSEQATLINLTTIPYPESGMKYILKGPCYLNFKNLDSPDDIKNIWVDTYDGKGDPSFRFRGPDSYEQVRKEDKEAALDAMCKGMMPSY